MATRKGSALLHWPILLTPLLVALSAPQAQAGDSDAEREQLAALSRAPKLHYSHQVAQVCAPACIYLV